MSQRISRDDGQRLFFEQLRGEATDPAADEDEQREEETRNKILTRASWPSSVACEADAYAGGAATAGHEVRRIEVAKLEFRLFAHASRFRGGHVSARCSRPDRTLGHGADQY